MPEFGNGNLQGSGQLRQAEWEMGHLLESAEQLSLGFVGARASAGAGPDEHPLAQYGSLCITAGTAYRECCPKGWEKSKCFREASCRRIIKLHQRAVAGVAPQFLQCPRCRSGEQQPMFLPPRRSRPVPVAYPGEEPDDRRSLDLEPPSVHREMPGACGYQHHGVAAEGPSRKGRQNTALLTGAQARQAKIAEGRRGMAVC